MLLNREGPIIGAAGARADRSRALLYNEFAVIVGLVYNYLPFVVLAIFASLGRVSTGGARGLGRSRRLGLDTFRRVTLPLTMPGIAAGCVFVFVLSIGNFVTPALLGRRRVQMVGKLVYDQFLSARDWPFGSALAGADRRHAAAAVRCRPGAASNGGQRRAAPMLSAADRAPAGSAGHLGALLLFLYVPILVAGGAFLQPEPACRPPGPASRSIGTARCSPTPTIRRALANTLIVAVVTTAIATALGTLLALGLVGGGAPACLEALMFAPMIIPDIVLAIALASFYHLLDLTLGLTRSSSRHVVFDIAFVCAVVRTRLKHFDRSIIEASIDLGAIGVRRPSGA